MKKIVSAVIVMLAVMVFGCVVCSASIISSKGPGQIGYSSVVLCSTLSLHTDPSYDSAVTQTLQYGDRIIVASQKDGWARVVLGDAEDSPSGWVNDSYIAVDPAWYRTDEDTPVYAWNSTSAPKVGLLDGGTTLPILRDDGDWIIVSLRGAAAWINNPNRTASQDNVMIGQGSAQSSGGNTNTSQSSGSASAGSSQEEEQTPWFTVYARDGSTESIHLVGGAMYEDARGRTYSKQDNDGFYYCITTDKTYAFDPGAWTGEAYGENEFPAEDDLTGEDYGENQDLTGEDYGENQDA